MERNSGCLNGKAARPKELEYYSHGWKTVVPLVLATSGMYIKKFKISVENNHFKSHFGGKNQKLMHNILIL